MDLLLPLTLAFLSAGEWAIVLVLVVLLFGAAKIPQLARSLGQAKGEFERASRGSTDAKSADKAPAEDSTKVLEAARAMGIATEGRPIDDIKRDIKARLG